MNGRDLDLVRRLAEESDAPEVEVIAARRLLQQAIAAEKSRKRGWTTRLVPAAGIVALLVVVAIIGGELIRPTPASAALTEIAIVAEGRDPFIVSRGQAVYVRSERIDLVQFDGEDLPEAAVPVVSFLLPQTREVWVRADGTRRLVTNASEPVFFDEAVAAAFAGSDVAAPYGIGETIVTELGAPEVELPLDALTADPDILRNQILELTGAELSGRSELLRVFETAAALLRETDASPALRGAAVRVLASLGDDIDVASEGDIVSVSLEYSLDGLAYSRSIQLDRTTSALVGEAVVLIAGDPATGVPVGTAIVSATYSVPAVVVLP